jgi:hypothetical protein
MRYKQMMQTDASVRNNAGSTEPSGKLTALRLIYHLEREKVMISKLIQLEDGTLVQVEATGNETQQISGGAAEKVEGTFDRIRPVLLNVCRPLVVTVKSLHEHVELEQVEVEVGLSFDIEGNMFVTKTNFGTNILVRMTLKKQ